MDPWIPWEVVAVLLGSVDTLWQPLVWSVLWFLQLVPKFVTQYVATYLSGRLGCGMCLRAGNMGWQQVPCRRVQQIWLFLVTTDILKIQKRVLRIITSNSRLVSCRHLFKRLKILTLPSQYIYSVLVFVAENRNQFVFNRDIHSCNTRHNLDLHLPSTHLTVVQKGVLYSGSKIFNHLPAQIKNQIDNLHHFKKTLKNYLLMQSLYSLEEFYQQTIE